MRAHRREAAKRSKTMRKQSSAVRKMDSRSARDFEHAFKLAVTQYKGALRRLAKR